MLETFNFSFSFFIGMFALELFALELYYSVLL